MLQRLGREKLIFGHRGAPHEAPENTLAGFQRAVELALDGVELDARLCKTGRVVVFHDDRVDKLTDGTGFVSELSFEELRELDAGAHFGGRYRGQKIPTLEEVLELLGGRMLVNVELKSRSITNNGLEGKVVEIIRKMGLQSSVILSSFNPFSIRRVIGIDPRLKVGLLFSDNQPVHLKRAWAAHIIRIDGVHPRYPLVTGKLVQKAGAKRWFVVTWTVDEATDAANLFDLGVDVVISNRPVHIRECMRNDKGEMWSSWIPQNRLSA